MGYEFSKRDALAVTGVASVLSARHFYRAKQLWPFRLSVILAWPTIGVAIMETVINNNTQRNVTMLSAQQPEGVEQAREANAAFVARMRHNADALSHDPSRK
uniref:Uncharacterized protein n=1 Tax=Chlamydomonas euryale TaxID=1486919 RepID=A0A7R9VV54_9CHLO|mmetsp:Transcript_45369/g.135370  ORF Transcript_45369/g.135370 Transcript_45369/m.135370 type:complete len:102 (+) Transcript_45369:227-532(+)